MGIYRCVMCQDDAAMIAVMCINGLWQAVDFPACEEHVIIVALRERTERANGAPYGVMPLDSFERLRLARKVLASMQASLDETASCAGEDGVEWIRPMLAQLTDRIASESTTVLPISQS